MKIKPSSLLAATFLCALVVLPLEAQTGAVVTMQTVPVSATTNDVATDSKPDEKNSAKAETQPTPTENGAAVLAARNQVEISRNMGDTVTQVVAIIAGCSIPIAFVAVIGLYLFFRHRKNIMLHDTLRAMIDKGTPIPPELLHSPQSNQARRPRNDFRTGLILVGIGAALEFSGSGRAGMIVLFMGFAFLLVTLFDKRRSNHEADLKDDDVRVVEKTSDQPPKI
jgi:Domain of unknown function (DUF6249)